MCSQVMLSNAGIKEADLIERLNDINVEKGVHNSMFGGDAVHVLNTLCDQLYLEKGNGVDDGETVPHYFLGLRARKEITKERCVAFMEMCNGAPLNNSFKSAHPHSSFCANSPWPAYSSLILVVTLTLDVFCVLTCFPICLQQAGVAA